MKYQDLIRKLKDLGCKLHRQGAKHEIWINPETEQTQIVPRHKEINEYTARGIIKGLESAFEDE